jgi:predicted TIM-barrel fold metal-dependent hydrolase
MISGAVDCDIHANVPETHVLMPFLPDYWREQVTTRAIDGLDLNTYPPKTPLYARDDWRPQKGKAATTLQLMRSQALDRFNPAFAICNVVYGAQAVFNADLSAALCSAVNDWIIKEWLDKEPRLRASIVVPFNEPELAVEEIEKRANDRRFVQVLLLTGSEMPLGRRHFWPIYRAAERHGLPVGIHAGATARHASTYTGWPSHYIEDYSAQAQSFQGQLLSLIYEGVFVKFPKLKVVLIESGVTWLPSFLSRADHTWRALRAEVPWLNRAPSQFARDHIRLTTQPIDAPDDAGAVARIIDMIDSDEMLLFASDYPHWQFDGDEILPAGLSSELIRKITIDNPFATYPRLRGTAQ